MIAPDARRHVHAQREGNGVSESVILSRHEPAEHRARAEKPVYTNVLQTAPLQGPVWPSQPIKVR